MIATLRQNGQIISGLTKKFIWGTFIGNANIYIAKWIHYTSYYEFANVAISVLLIYHIFVPDVLHSRAANTRHQR